VSLGLVVAEIWGEIPAQRGIFGGDLNGGDGIEDQGVVV